MEKIVQKYKSLQKLSANNVVWLGVANTLRIAHLRINYLVGNPEYIRQKPCNDHHYLEQVL